MATKRERPKKSQKKNFSKVTKTEWKTSLIIAELRAVLALRKEVLGNETSNGLMLRLTDRYNVLLGYFMTT